MATGNDPVLGKVKPPAIGLIVTAALTLLTLGWGMIDTYFLGGGGQPAPPDLGDNLQQAQEASKNPIFGIIALLVNAFIIFASVKMMKLESWGMALTASILAMIPCFTCFCCVLGVPSGIWSIVVLVDPQVKAAFK
jgi:hypothetical protein